MDINDKRLTGGSKKKEKAILLNKLSLTWPFRLLVCGSSGSGKTYATLGLCLNWIPWKTIGCYAKHLDSDLWVRFREAIEKMERRRKQPISSFSDTLDDAIPVDELISENRSLIIVDDFILSKDLSAVQEYFVRGRHKNASVVFISQSWYPIPKMMRENATHAMIFKGWNGHDASGMWKDLAPGMTREQFDHFLREGTTPQYSFCFFDTNPRKEELRYRIGFDKLIIPDSGQEEDQDEA